ncbi:MAG TPA: hypothetical protein DHD79_01510 [Firmicutes bacterium]|jgi:hypothetical protein|nr:hypothetical protein [Bacillota bacterium]HCX69901.1 hypothetical protein [Bacillota bacterium]
MTQHTKLPILGEKSFRLKGETHQLVTFLNKTLKDRDLIFGLTLDGTNYRIIIYDSSNNDHPEGDSRE